MAFGGAPAFVAIQSSGRGNLLTRMTGATLAANVGAFDATGAAADSGLLNSNNGAIDPVPANTTSLPTTYGPGPDNWSQEDVDALIVHLNDTANVNTVWNVLLIANVNPAPAGSNITNANVRIGLHNTTPAIIAAGLVALIQSVYSASK